ncbi:hypothetical protein [Staphylococcus simiae]|uniref:Uncharacterized protein n=1 Tax=Staphylococcus simiae CCM 7213 = CCUG 51256 TaxID=911238 RepID=G5JKR8_9STAP|nr:hypothetical protein [Staphylococcus simiae]EHJ07197.1 hypothetical protein SS7213T_10399 [Staphylococcus simiae CCM 7213 = CCUG 51256]
MSSKINVLVFDDKHYQIKFIVVALPKISISYRHSHFKSIDKTN